MPSVAIAASANANAAAANAAAARAKRIACMKYVPGYQHDRATVAEMRQYAECVEILHPEPLTGAEALWIKAAILACFIGIGVGSRIGWKDGGLGDAVFFGFVGAIVAPCAVGAVWLVIAMLRFLGS